jgi:glucose/arabinose dehydrogenase
MDMRLLACCARCHLHSLMRTLIALLSALLCLLAIAPAMAQELRAIPVASGLQNPWSLAFLPDGRMLVTERPGRLRVVGSDGSVGEPVQGVPAVAAGGQGGLLDVAVDPKFTENGFIYLSYSEPDPSGRGGNSTAAARGKLRGNQLTQVQLVFRQQPKFASRNHFGSRFAFAPDGRLFITLGDRFSRRDDAQTLDNHHGKVVRINPDGSVPTDNPFASTATGRTPSPPALPEIWSYGHRNVQGATIHPQTGALWTHEHGPQGGDELNIAEPGKNYGWPVITYGAEYGSGTPIGEGTARPGMEQPLHHWVPSIAPSGMVFLTSDRYPGWKGNLFIGALRGQMLVRLELDGRKVLKEHRLLQNLGERIRDVRQGPDGWLYLVTDSANGRVLRLQP